MKMTPLIAAALLAGCAAQAPTPEAATRADQRFAKATRGLVPGEPQACISSLGLRGPDQVDAATLVYRNGANNLWVNRLDQPCPGLDEDRSIPVVRSFTGTQFCEGDTFTLIDRAGGFPRGGLCRFGKFTPYRKAK